MEVIMSRHVSLSVLLLLAGCLLACGSSSSNSSTDAVSNDSTTPVQGKVLTLPDFTPPEKNAIVGRIVNRGGVGIEGAVASIDGGKSGTSNFDGFYFIADVPPAERWVVRFEKTGFIPTTRTSELFQDGRVTVNAVLAQQGPGRSISTDDNTPTIVDRGTVALNKAAVVDKNGAAVTGNISLRVTPIEVKGQGVAAAPGDFSATTTLGGTVQLETFAMADYELTDDDGNTLAIKDGEKATVEMLLPADTTLKVGDEVPAWYFDKESGRWVEEGKGVVQKYSQDESRLSFLAEVGHFSTWNCDQQMETTCVTGQVTLCDGTPASGADLMSQGIDYDGTSHAVAGSDGNFCINARKGSTVSLAAAHGYGANRLVTAVEVNTPDTTASCPTGPCATQNIKLPCSPADSNVDCDDTYFAGCKSCITGLVVDDEGVAQSAIIKVTTGSTTYTVVTDSQGRYCAPAAKDSLASLSASGAQGQTGATTFTPTVAGSCPSCEEAPNIVLDTATSSEDDIDFTDCQTTIDGVTLSPILLNGANGAFASLNAGWALISDTRTEDDPEPEYPWTITVNLVSSKSDGLNGQPVANFQLQLATAPTATQSYVVGPDMAEGYSFTAQAVSAVGTIVGLGNEIYEISDTVGTGTVTLNTFSKIGDKVTGSFDLTFASQCAPNGASVRIRGQIDTKARALNTLFPSITDIESEEYTAWKCWLFEFFLWAQMVESWQHGAIQTNVDGSIVMTEDNLLNGAEYLWDTDTFNLREYGDDFMLIAGVDSPKPGENLVTSGSMTLPGQDDCYYEVQSGKVTLQDFSTSTTWIPGTFDIDFKASDDSTGTCTSHKLTGQFGAAVCRE